MDKIIRYPYRVSKIVIRSSLLALVHIERLQSSRRGGKNELKLRPRRLFVAQIMNLISISEISADRLA